MCLQLYDIIPPLQPYVKVICSIEYKATPSCSQALFVLPDNCVELFVTYAGQPHNIIMTRMSHTMKAAMEGSSGCIAICFFPGMAYPFFPMPMSELANQVINVEYAWKGYSEIEERIRIAASTLQRVAILQEYLYQVLKKYGKSDLVIDFCVDRIKKSKGQLRVSDLSRETGLSSRQLTRRFNDHIGIPPKKFTSTTRFIHALRELKKYPATSLTEIALESGYYDQAHFIHDVNHYTGLTPGQLLVSENILY